MKAISRILLLLTGIVLGAALFEFALENNSLIRLEFVWWRTAPLYVWLLCLIAFSAGFVTALLFVLVYTVRLKRAASQQERLIHQLRREVEEARGEILPRAGDTSRQAGP